MTGSRVPVPGAGPGSVLPGDIKKEILRRRGELQKKGRSKEEWENLRRSGN